MPTDENMFEDTISHSGKRPGALQVGPRKKPYVTEIFAFPCATISESPTQISPGVERTPLCTTDDTLEGQYMHSAQ